MNETTSAFLIWQHDQIDAGFQLLLDGPKPPDAAAMAGLTESLELLQHHIFLEEAILFPMLEQNGPAAAVAVMQYEHGQMWPLLERLQRGCDQGLPTDVLQALCRELFELLQVHNPKEEQEVYEAIDKLVALGAGGERLLAMLDATDAPQGWVCAMARQSDWT